jgi:hypothetical protein
MNRDRIERALREPGPRERGYSPEALPATAAELRARVPRRRGLLMSAGGLGGLAAAVAAGAVVAVVLTRGFSHAPGNIGTGSNPTTTPTLTSTPTVALTPTPSPATVAACRAGDFAWSADPWGGAAGSRGTIILARAVASLGTCDLNGEATITLRDGNGGVLVTAHTATTTTRVRAGQLFQIRVSWSNWCGAEPGQPIQLQLRLPGDSTAFSLIPSNDQGLTFKTCNGPGQPSVLNGTSFQPSDRAPQG